MNSWTHAYLGTRTLLPETNNQITTPFMDANFATPAIDHRFVVVVGNDGNGKQISKYFGVFHGESMKVIVDEYSQLLSDGTRNSDFNSVLDEAMQQGKAGGSNGIYGFQALKFPNGTLSGLDVREAEMLSGLVDTLDLRYDNQPLINNWHNSNTFAEGIIEALGATYDPNYGPTSGIAPGAGRELDFDLSYSSHVFFWDEYLSSRGPLVSPECFPSGCPSSGFLEQQAA